MVYLCKSSLTLFFNSLAPGKFEWNFRYAIFKQIVMIDGWGISCEIALIWMPLDFIDDQSTLVQVMAWCRQATSHYLSQCWPRSLSPYGVTRPQWVNWFVYAQGLRQWTILHQWRFLSLAKNLFRKKPENISGSCSTAVCHKATQLIAQWTFLISRFRLSLTQQATI